MPADPQVLTVLLLDESGPRRDEVARALEQHKVRVHAVGELEDAALEVARDGVDVVLATPLILKAQPRAMSTFMAALGAVPVVIVPPPAEPTAAGLEQAFGAYVEGALSVADAASRMAREGSSLGVAGAPDADDEEMRQLVLSGTRAMITAMERRSSIEDGEFERVAEIAVAIAEELGGFDLDRVRTAAELHDLGRLGVSSEVWSKSGPLTDVERQEMQRHPVIGLQMLRPLLNDPQLLAGILWHHERWDGTGYPDRLRGDEIPPLARVIAVADALEALTTARPHRAALSWDEAVAEVTRSRGTQFDPMVVDALLAIEPELRKRFDSDAAVAGGP